MALLLGFVAGGFGPGARLEAHLVALLNLGAFICACFGALFCACFGVAICSVGCWGAATVFERSLDACALSNSLLAFRLLKLVQVPFFSNALFTGSG